MASADWLGECGDNEMLAELKGAGDDGFTETGEVVLVPLADYLDEAVQTEPFQDSGNLPTGLSEMALKVAVAEASDFKLAADDCKEGI